MKTAVKNINDLVLFIEKLFGVNLSNLDLTKYDNRIPTCLKYLYAIEDFFAVHNCKFETIRFFNNQYHLIPSSKLELENEYFDFIYENQNNWRVAIHKDSNSIYLSEHYELPYNTRLNETLEDFLISFALHEILFNCNYYCQLDYKEIDELKKELPLQLIWSGRLIDYPIEFYITKQHVLIMNAGWIVLSTNDEIVFENMKRNVKIILF